MVDPCMITDSRRFLNVMWPLEEPTNQQIAGLPNDHSIALDPIVRSASTNRQKQVLPVTRPVRRIVDTDRQHPFVHRHHGRKRAHPPDHVHDVHLGRHRTVGRCEASHLINQGDGQPPLHLGELWRRRTGRYHEKKGKRRAHVWSRVWALSGARLGPRSPLQRVAQVSLRAGTRSEKRGEPTCVSVGEVQLSLTDRQADFAG